MEKIYSVVSLEYDFFIQKTITWRFWAVSLKDNYRMLLGYNIVLIFRPVIIETGSKLVLRACAWNAAAFGHCASSFVASQINV